MTGFEDPGVYGDLMDEAEKNYVEDPKIIQIIPATGWFAKYEVKGFDENIYYIALVAWALREDGSMVGMETQFGDIQPTRYPKNSDFKGFVYDPSIRPVDRWREES